VALGCSPPLPPSSTGSSESNGGSTGEESTTSSSESGSETGEPVLACTNEWDCGVGERCLDGLCTCLGCACQSPSVAQGTVDALEPDEDEVPVTLDLIAAECNDDSDCAPLEICHSSECVETTACVAHEDCYADWWPEDRFCVDGLCDWINCYADGDDGCPLGALCPTIQCQWLQVVPSCADVPSFDEVVVHTLDAPDTASFVILDVNLDARDDVVVLDDGGVYWLISTGVGFEPPTSWAIEPGTQIVAIAGADIHGDGVDELLVSHAAPPGVEILAAGASWPQWVGFAPTMVVPEAARMLDVDFDGLPDVVTGSSVVGPMTLVEAGLGDGTGTFESLWAEEAGVGPFEFSQPAPSQDDELECTRALGSIESDALGARGLAHDGVAHGYSVAVPRTTAGHMFFPEGFVATAPLIDRGVLFFPLWNYVGIGPAPGAVAFLSRDVGIHHVLVDHGVEAAEFVEFEVNAELEWDAFMALCRGSLGFSLDSVALDVGDFDGDGREDLLSQGTDGVLRTWLSRD
jgi:hypothetical protein